MHWQQVAHIEAGWPGVPGDIAAQVGLVVGKLAVAVVASGHVVRLVKGYIRYVALDRGSVTVAVAPIGPVVA